MPATQNTSRSRHTRNRRIAAVALFTTLTAAACDASQTTTPAGAPAANSPATAPAAPASAATKPDSVDYSRLLLQAADLSDAEDTFAVRTTTDDPNGLPGASALFVNADDTRAIADTFVVYPDAATASATLKQAASTLNTIVAGGKPEQSPVGSDGVVISGTSPDGAKAVTLLLYTEGPALVRLEFDSAPGDATTDAFVNSVGRMQQIALRIGLPSAQ